MIRQSRQLILGVALAALSGCEDNMRDQARIKPLEPSQFFADGRSARPLPPGTIARGQLRENDDFFTGKRGGKFVEQIPVTLSRELLQRGRQRFEIVCANCHGLDGFGNGIIVEHGFSPPPSYHIDRLRAMPDGYFFDVITHGKGAMYPQAERVAIEDRWAIAAYIRALQLSQNAKSTDVPDNERSHLEEHAP
ncbi:MAG TPA: cytochrome c [Planctomycetota bacterium]|nr:cytochrome c [Planctomycetota bacterium]